jgi:hypothetical protein
MTFSTPPPSAAPRATSAVRALRDGLLVVRRIPLAAWLIALLFVISETGCEYVASRYHEVALTAFLVTSDRVIDEHGEVVATFGPDDSVAFQEVWLASEVEDGTMLVGPRRATGAEAIGWVIGAWLAAIPILLVVFLIQAALLPRYLAAQLRALGHPMPTLHAAPPYRRVLGAVAIASSVDLAAALLAAIPGVLLAWIAAALIAEALAVAILIATLLGCSAVFVYVRLGVLFLTREVIWGGSDLPTAARTSWSIAARHRWAVLQLALLAIAAEMVGALGWMLGIVGLITHPPARVLRDGALTRGYVDLRGLS